MRTSNILFLTCLLLLTAPAMAQSPSTPSDQSGWTTLLFIQRVDDRYLDEPAAVRMGDHPNRPWSMERPAGEMPAGLGRGAATHETFVVLDVGGDGRAAGCRPLRVSADPRLDSLSCRLLMRPGYFNAFYGRTRGPVPQARWVLGLRFETMDVATAAAREAETLRPPPAPPTPPRAGLPARTQQDVAPTTGPRRVVRGSYSASDYLDLAHLPITNGIVRAELEVDAQGIPTACRITGSSGNGAIDARTCELLIEEVRYSTRVDAAGNPIGDTMAAMIDVGWLTGRGITPR